MTAIHDQLWKALTGNEFPRDKFKNGTICLRGHPTTTNILDEEYRALWREEYDPEFDDHLSYFEPPEPSQHGRNNVQKERLIILERQYIDVKVRGRQPHDKGAGHQRNIKKRTIRFGRQKATWRGYLEDRVEFHPMTTEKYLNEHAALT